MQVCFHVAMKSTVTQRFNFDIILGFSPCTYESGNQKLWLSNISLVAQRTMLPVQTHHITNISKTNFTEIHISFDVTCSFRVRTLLADDSSGKGRQGVTKRQPTLEFKELTRTNTAETVWGLCCYMLVPFGLNDVHQIGPRCSYGRSMAVRSWLRRRVLEAHIEHQL